MAFVVVLAVIVVVFVVGMRAMTSGHGRRTRGPGAGATGAVYDMLNEDKRKAIEIIVEGRAEYTDPETADDVPDEERS